MIAAQQFITKQGLVKLQDELEFLKKDKRRQIAERLKKAIEQGDLSENAEYQDAKEEQARLEGQIIELSHTIKNAEVIKKEKNGHISVGSKIKVKTGGQEFEFEIVGSEEADPAQGKISNASPLGQAFIGHKKGEKVEVQIPEGSTQYKVLEVS